MTCIREAPAIMIGTAIALLGLSPTGLAGAAVVRCVTADTTVVRPAPADTGKAAGQAGRTALPTGVSGGLYLFHYAPLRLEGARARTEVYALFLDLDRAWNDFGLHVEARARDTRLRPYYPGTVWFQEAYGYYQSPVGRLMAGKLYRRIGRFWDGSFFGNLQYFDGVKLDPDFGLALEGERSLDRTWSAEYSAQYFTVSDGINGALDGRDVESAAEQRERDTWVARISPRLHLRPRLSIAVGASYQNGRIERPEGSDRLRLGAVDAEVRGGPGLVYVEYTISKGRNAPAPPQLAGASSDDVRYWLAGGQLQVGPVALRYNYSRADYRGAGVTESIHQPGGTLRITDGLSAILELDYWESGGAVFDRSLSLVLLATF